MTIWYISDPHFSHANLVTKFKLADGSPARKFANVEEMDAVIIQRWNEVVRPEDHVWCLGDVSFIRPRMDSILPRLLGHKRLILGNHDKFSISAYARHFQKIRGSQVHDGILFTHIPVAPWSFGKFKANVHGHTHASLPLIYGAPSPKLNGLATTHRSSLDSSDTDLLAESRECIYINLCVENVSYRPVALETIQAWVEKASRSGPFTP
jgi:calcineurin-like phosphoesterase family protein